MSELNQKLEEVKRLQECYLLYRECDYPKMRRRVHVQLDRFLMENRELAIMSIEKMLEDEIAALTIETKKSKRNKIIYDLDTQEVIVEPELPWYRKLLPRRKGGAMHDKGITRDV